MASMGFQNSRVLLRPPSGTPDDTSRVLGGHRNRFAHQATGVVVPYTRQGVCHGDRDRLSRSSEASALLR